MQSALTNSTDEVVSRVNRSVYELVLKCPAPRGRSAISESENDEVEAQRWWLKSEKANEKEAELSRDIR